MYGCLGHFAHRRNHDFSLGFEYSQPVNEVGGTDCAGMIDYPKIGIEKAGATVFHAGTGLADGDITATGGRVLGVTALGDDIAKAQASAYQAVERIDWPGGFYRRDIGWRAVGR